MRQYPSNGSSDKLQRPLPVPEQFLPESWPLSPMQQGMLFHSLRDRHSGVDVEQMVARLAEPLDPETFRRAWEGLINRHSAFRSSFEWDGRPEPVQIEHPHVRSPGRRSTCAI